MGGSQIPVGRRREPDGPAQGRQDGPPPKNWSESVADEETLMQPNDWANSVPSDPQSLDPRDNDPHISDKVRAEAKQLAGKVDGSQKLPRSTGALLQSALAACTADLRRILMQIALEATEDERKRLLSEMSAGGDATSAFVNHS